ncbi:MAG: 5'-nucleotidase [Mediterranea sp.]|jgi:5'-nucleotidase|nr:5'-nucleotidase [Mediterranea sp.]
MPYPIEKKLVIAVASSALFDLTESDSVFKAEGVQAYTRYQERNVDVPFQRGVAFPFVSRLLKLNEAFAAEEPVEVVLMSRNSPETGMRTFRSIKRYGLNITRAAFSSGAPHFQYLPAFNATLFLSANEEDVRAALDNGFAAGRVLNTIVVDDDDSRELRIGFDFDGVLASDEAERIYEETGDLERFHQHEEAHADEPLKIGPVGELLKRVSNLQQLERQKRQEDADYQPMIKTAIITARNAPAHERVINTLKAWDVEVDEAFFLGGIQKARFLNILKPHIFFDDQMVHLDHIDKIPAVHIPFGVKNG